MIEHIYKQIDDLNQTDPASHGDRLCKLFEEVGELAQAVNMTTGRKISKLNDEQVRSLILEEAADSIQNIFSITNGYGISLEEIVKTIELKNLKWTTVIKMKQTKNGK